MADALADAPVLAFAADLAWLFAAVWAVHVAAYFALGHAIEAWNARHPDRKIQAGRDGMRRRREEQVQSLGSMAVTSGCMALAFALQRAGLTLWGTPSSLDPVWVIGMTAAVILGYDCWYYWAHRLMHVPRFYRWHRLHHRSTAPTVWTADSQSWRETLLIQTWMPLAAVLLPAPWLALVLHRLFDHVSGQLGHSGFEYFADRSARAPSPMVCTSFHDAHHELFHWNYGNYFSVWDRICGTLHPDYDARVDRIAAGAAPDLARQAGARQAAQEGAR